MSVDSPSLRRKLITTVEGDWVDVRLALGSAIAWVVTAIGIGWGSSPIAVVAGLSALVGVLALAIGALPIGRVGSGSSFLTGFALAGFCSLLVLSPLAMRLNHLENSELRKLAKLGARASAVVVLDDDPRPIGNQGTAGPPRVIVEATAATVEVGGRSMSYDDKVLILASQDQWRDFLPGQRLRIDVRVRQAIDDPLIAATFEASSAPTAIGRAPWWQRAAGVVRRGLLRATADLPADVAGLLPGLVDGDTSRLDPVVAEHFRAAGMSHLVAVSGSNCAIVVGAVFLLLRRWRLSPWPTAGLSAVMLVAFVIVARPSPSVMRAATMAGIALLAYALGRTKAVLPALSASVLALLVWDPSLALDAGFTMSVLATAAIVTVAPRWANGLRRRRCPPVLAESIAVAASAHLVTAPVAAAISGHVSVVAILANVLAEPVVPFVTLFGFVAAAIAPLCLPLGALLAEAAGWPCRWLIWVAERCGGLDGAVIGWPSGLTGAVLLIAVGVLTWRMLRSGPFRRLVTVVLLGVLVAQIPMRAVVHSWRSNGLIFIACDVGQGDGLVLPIGPASAVVVDAGPDPVPMARCLDDLGITEVPLVVLTHLHMDHVGGLSGVLHGRRVDRVITGPLLTPATGDHLVKDVLSGHNMQLGTTSAGAVFDYGPLHLDVLGPRSAFHRTRSDPNNSSVILRATVGSTRLLLLGDAELEAQQDLLDNRVDLQADVVKVAHHGSAYSLPAVLEATQARLAVISVGAGNDFGHPAPLTLGVLLRLGIGVKRTDVDGEIAIASDAGRLSCLTRNVR